MDLDHICIAVRKIDPARKKLCSMLGYTVRTEKITNTRQEVIVQFLHKLGSIDLKLIEPSGPTSPLIEFVKKGGGLHHLCFHTGDGKTSVQKLALSGARVTAEPEPGEAFNDHLISFLYLGFGLNIEVIDTDERRGEISGPD